MSRVADDLEQRRLRLGAVGSLGAITLLWVARVEPALFVVGTVILTMSVVPLAAGFGTRGGLLIGLLAGVLWVAAKLGVTGPFAMELVVSPSNAISALAMMAIGVLSGAFFGTGQRFSSSGSSGSSASSTPTPPSAPPPSPETEKPSAELQEDLRQSLDRFRNWMAEWDGQGDPWSSFDTHLRQLLRRLAQAQRIRCYHIDPSGELCPLNSATPGPATGISPEDGLVNHVLTTGRRVLTTSPGAGEMIQALAEKSQLSATWLVPIRSQGRTCGLVTVGTFADDTVAEKRLELVADLVAEFWQHLRTADDLRLARLMDRSSGVLNRVEILAILDQTVERCYADNEPVVMLALVIEGIRKMDDGGQWKLRNDVIEAIGRTMQERLRRDDVVGRFSDDRFVAILRRLDLPLACLITRKILEAVEQELRRRIPEEDFALRAGLAGSGFDRVSAQSLLLKAFSDITEARDRNMTILPYFSESPAEATNG